MGQNFEIFRKIRQGNFDITRKIRHQNGKFIYSLTRFQHQSHHFNSTFLPMSLESVNINYMIN